MSVFVASLIVLNQWLDVRLCVVCSKSCSNAFALGGSKGGVLYI